MERMNETLDLKLNELSANTAEVTGTAGMVNTAEMAESPTAAEQSGTEQSGTGLDALVCGTDVPQGTVVMAATPIGNTADAPHASLRSWNAPTSWPPKTPAVSTRSPTVSACT